MALQCRYLKALRNFCKPIFTLDINHKGFVPQYSISPNLNIDICKTLSLAAEQNITVVPGKCRVMLPGTHIGFPGCITHVLCCLRCFMLLVRNNITHLRQHKTCVMQHVNPIWVPGNITHYLPGTTDWKKCGYSWFGAGGVWGDKGSRMPRISTLITVHT